jgi:DNA polymerase III delta subunit
LGPVSLKFSTGGAFEQHIHSLSDTTGSAFYAVIASDLLERRYFSSLILGAFKKTHPTAEVVAVDLSKACIKRLQDECATSDLFAVKKILHFFHLEEASKVLLDAFRLFIQSGTLAPLTVFQGEHVKNDPKFFDKLGVECVVLDLTQEKPWEKKNRIIHWVSGCIQKNKKSIHKGILDNLYERCHKNLSHMMQEVEKLICYAKDSSIITEEHVKMLCFLEEETSSWSLAEAIVWEEQGIAMGAAYPMDAHQFYPMLGQLRYHYQMGVKMKALLAHQIDETQLSTYFPTLQPKTLSKYYQNASRSKEEKLKKALNFLFECEVKAKSQSIDIRLLWLELMANLK